MEALKNLFNEIGIPYQVLFAIIVVVFFTEASKDACKSLEKYLEEKKGKEIKIFDHTKIIFLIFWSAIACVCLALAKIITWVTFPLYLFAIIGCCSFLYELIIKKVKTWLKNV